MRITFDHLGQLVPDLADASARLEAFGFTLARETMDPALPGCRQRSIMFERGSIQVQENSDPHSSHPLARAARRYFGNHVLAFSVPDAHAARAQIAANGLPVGKVTEQSRPVSEPDIDKQARFSSFAADYHPNDESFLLWVQHLTPEALRSPRLITHANGARRLVSVQVACETDTLHVVQMRLHQCLAGPTAWDNPDDVLNAVGLPISVQAIPRERLPRLLAARAWPSPAYIAAPLIAVSDVDVIKHLAAEQHLAIEQLRRFHYVDLGGAVGVFGFFEDRT